MTAVSRSVWSAWLIFSVFSCVAPASAADSTGQTAV